MIYKEYLQFAVLFLSQYDTNTPEPGPKGIPGLLVNKSIRMQGFLVFDFAEKYEEATDNLVRWIDSGQFQVLTDELDGFFSISSNLALFSISF